MSIENERIENCFDRGNSYPYEDIRKFEALIPNNIYDVWDDGTVTFKEFFYIRIHLTYHLPIKEKA